MNQSHTHTSLPGLPSLPSREAEAAYDEEARRFSERFGPGFWVAARCRFPAAFPDENGDVVMLEAGSPVEPYKHFRPDDIDRLLDRGVIFRGSEAGGRVQTTPADARYVALRSFTSSRGMILPGAEVRPEFLSGGQDALDSLVKRGLVRDNQTAKAEEIAFRASLAEVDRAEAELASATDKLVEHDDTKNRAAYFKARDERDVIQVRHAAVIAKRGSE